MESEYCLCLTDIVTEAEENDFLPESWHSDAGTESCMFWRRKMNIHLSR